MTFDEIESKLPNGFHDASILDITFNCLEAYSSIKMLLHFGRDDVTGEEEYRTGILEVFSVYLFFIDRPDSKYSMKIGEPGLGVSGDSLSIGQDSAIDLLLNKLPNGFCGYRFFIEEWNSFFYIAAASANFYWQ